MTRKTEGQVSFNAGEISPAMTGRIDLAQYASGLATATNVFVKPLGPVRRRNGTKYIAEVKDSSSTARLIDFKTSGGQSYILEFGNTYLRFYTTQAQVQEADVTVTGITKANPGVVTATAHGYANGDQVYLSGVVGMTEVNGFRFTVANVAANTFELSGVNTTSYTTYVSGGVANRIYTLTTPYSASEADDIQVTQLGNSLYIAHPSYEPRVLEFTSSTSWELTTLGSISPPTIELGHTGAEIDDVTPGATTGVGVAFTADSAIFLDGDIGREIVNLSGNGRATITALGGAAPHAVATCDVIEDFPSTAKIAPANWKLDLSPIADIIMTGTKLKSIITVDADLPVSATASLSFRTGDVGKYILVSNGVIKITQRISGSQIKGQVVKALDSADETANWTLEEVTWTSTRGYPKAIGAFEERLVLGGTTAQPQGLWFSETGSPTRFGIGAGDSDAVSATLAVAGTISWIGAARDLIIGTSLAETSITSGGTGGITPTSIQQKPRTYHGSSSQKLANIGDEIIFYQFNKRKILSYSYRFETDGFKGEDLTRISEHITSGNIKSITYAQEPYSIIVAVDEGGDLLVGTYKIDLGILAWCRWETDGSYESVQSISHDSKDEIWVIAKRTIDGSTKRYIELFDDGEGTDELDGYSDSYLVYSNPLTITGITKANPGVVTSTAHGLSNGDKVMLKSVLGMTEVNQRVYTVANVAANTFELSGVNTTSYTTYVSGGEAHLMISTISGLDHLEGATVNVKTDGSSHPNKTVSSGSITLDRTAAEVVIGLAYMSTIKTLNTNYDLNEGSQQGQRTRRPSPILRVYKSVIPSLNGQFIPIRQPSYNMNEAVPLYTGDLFYGPVSWDTTGQLTIELSTPFPLQLNAIFGTIEGGVK